MKGRRHVPVLASVIALAAATLDAASPDRALAQAQPPHVEVEVSAQAGRNPFLIPGADDFTVAGEIGASGKAGWDLGPGTVLGTEGNIAFRQYSGDYGNFATGRAIVALDHRHNEYLSFRSEASFDRQMPIDAMTETIDSAIDPISLQDHYQLAQDITWHADALTALHGRLAWTKLDPHGSSLLRSTTAIDATLDGSRQIDALTSIGVVGTMTWSRIAAGGGTPRSWSARATVARRIADSWRAQVEVGATRTSRLDSLDQPGASPAGPASPVQFAGTARLCHETDRINACAGATVDSVISSFGGIRRETSLNASLTWRMSEHGTLTGTANYRKTPGETGNDTIDATSLSARYDRRLDGRFSVFAGADYRRRTGISGRAADAVTFQIGVSIGIPRQ